MTIKKSYQRWLLAIILILTLVVILDWLVNHHHIQTDFLKRNNNQHDTAK